MTLDLAPQLFTFGSLSLRWLNLFAVLGLAVGLWTAVRLARSHALPTNVVLYPFLIAFPFAVLGGRVVAVLGAWEQYLVRPDDIWRITPSDLSTWGALVVGGLLLRLALRQQPARETLLDAAAFGLGVGLVLARLGAFLEGAGQGTESAVVWATRYTHAATGAPDLISFRHPAQLYEALALVCLLLLLRSLPRASAPGLRAWAFLAGYAAIRVALGPVMLQPPFLFGTQLDQLLALAVLLFALLKIGANTRRLRSNRLAVEPGQPS